MGLSVGGGSDMGIPIATVQKIDIEKGQNLVENP